LLERDHLSPQNILALWRALEKIENLTKTVSQANVLLF